MISYLKGTLEEISDTGIVVETSGIGYFILMPPSISAKFKLHCDIKVYTYMSVKEDSVSLFGFESQKQLEIFKKLTSVSGVGFKTAMGLLGAVGINDITAAIVSNDPVTLCRAPGLGKKSAQRIILELKDKVSNEDILTSVFGESNDSYSNDNRSEALEAMTALGYSRKEAVKALSAVYLPDDSTSVILKKALKKISEK